MFIQENEFTGQGWNFAPLGPMYRQFCHTKCVNTQHILGPEISPEKSVLKIWGQRSEWRGKSQIVKPSLDFSLLGNRAGFYLNVAARKEGKFQLYMIPQLGEVDRFKKWSTHGSYGCKIKWILIRSGWLERSCYSGYRGIKSRDRFLWNKEAVNGHTWKSQVPFPCPFCHEFRALWWFLDYTCERWEVTQNEELGRQSSGEKLILEDLTLHSGRVCDVSWATSLG